MLNTIAIIGYMAQEPKSNTTQKGEELSLLRLSHTRFGKDTQPLYIDVLAFRSSAKFANEFLHKGDLVSIQGQLDSDVFTRKDGTKGRTYRILADRVDILRKKEQAEEIEDVELPPELDVI